MSAKMATAGLLKIEVFWNKGYDGIIPVDDASNKILSRDLDYIVDVFMWLKFGNYSISLWEVITTSILYVFDQKNRFSGRWSRFKFNNLGLVLGKNLRFYTSVAKGLKLKARKFWGLIPTFLVTGKKLIGKRPFCPPPSHPE